MNKHILLNSLPGIYKELKSLRLNIGLDDNLFVNDKLFRMADVVIINSFCSESNEQLNYLDYDLCVKTPYSKELSWLFFRLKDIFQSRKLLNYKNKHEFYIRLAETAIKYHSKNGNGRPNELLISVYSEADNFLNDILKNIHPVFA